jgi:hypothetical protein
MTMTRPPCADREPQLEALLFDELAASEREALEAHLEACAPCREAIEDARLALRALAEIQDPPRAFEGPTPASDEAWNTFRAWVEKRPETPSAGAARRAALAAVLLLGIGIGWFLAKPGPPAAMRTTEEGTLDSLIRADLLADAGVRYVDGLRELFSDLTELSDEPLTVERAVATRERARSLLRDGRLLERALDPERDRQFLRAIGRAEIFLEEIAALEPSINGGNRGSVRLLRASLSESRLPSDLARLDVRREVESALAGSGSLADESLYRRKDF